MTEPTTPTENPANVTVASPESAAPAPAETKQPDTAVKPTESAESAGDKPESEKTSTPEAPKKSGAAGRISQLYAEKKAAEARAVALERELERVRFDHAKAQQTPLDHLPYEQQEGVRVRQALREDRLEMGASELEQTRAIAAQKRAETFFERVNEVRDRMPDFDQVFATIPLSDAAADILAESEKGPDVAYYLAKNPAEAARLHNLPAHMQGAEIARIEGKLDRASTARKVSQAPTPPPQIGGSTPAAVKDPASMTMDEYVAWRASAG